MKEKDLVDAWGSYYDRFGDSFPVPTYLKEGMSYEEIVKMIQGHIESGKPHDTTDEQRRYSHPRWWYG
jgi:hypothetical protein